MKISKGNKIVLATNGTVTTLSFVFDALGLVVNYAEIQFLIGLVDLMTFIAIAYKDRLGKLCKKLKEVIL